jgi:uncharacterized repeat protein (TIGR03806 family)
LKFQLNAIGFLLLATAILSGSAFAADDDLQPSSIKKTASKRLDALKRAFGHVPSRVFGSPDPPLPFRAERVLPKLKLSNPVFVINEPGSRRLLIIDQQSADGASRLFRTTDDPASGELVTLLDFPKSSTAFSITFHPRFAKNGYIYIGWNGPHDGEEKHTIVTRYTLGRKAPYKIDAKSALEIISWASNGHNGAAVAFGNDGLFYVTSGDGTSDSDTNVAGQGMDHLLSKLLRIDVDHPEKDRPYSVPNDNPFVGRKNVRPETWAYGFRNPWRMTVDRRTGDIWVGNNGQDLWEQAYLVQRGANYGWSVYEGGHEFYINRKLGPTPHVKPTVEHPHSEFRSLTGGVVYYGKKFPELRGTYIYGDHSTGKIWGARVEKGKLVWNKELADTTLHIAAFATDADGELLILDYQNKQLGGLYTFVRNSADSRNAKFPRKLSGSGLFNSVPGHRVHPGLIPYSVNAPLWSDGVHKERFLLLPATTGAGDEQKPTKINLKSNRGWEFPDGTVAVKSFALEMHEGDADSRQWIETRFLLREQGEWVGYSYAWNDEQTDAMLVDAKGIDRDFTVHTADGGSRKQAWRFPSRSECMVCHSRAAKYLLGLSTVQMNKRHNYDGADAHQFEVLEMLDLVKVKWNGDEAKKSPEGLKQLVNPYDERESLADRARSYLHANCAICHIDAGGGNSQMNLEFTTATDKMKLIDVPPIHHKFGIEDARLIAPGDPDRSVLLHRISIRQRGQMPQLATTLIDKPAVKLFRQWILSLEKPATKK